mmetsp:Transcript_11936/g.29956  ORF Transcript_11936/g.29956 Transcript_11936/m.29956 type:complete len:253 (-) Transcript_11936:169-927(-)
MLGAGAVGGGADGGGGDGGGGVGRAAGGVEEALPGGPEVEEGLGLRCGGLLGQPAVRRVHLRTSIRIPHVQERPPQLVGRLQPHHEGLRHPAGPVGRHHQHPVPGRIQPRPRHLQALLLAGGQHPVRPQVRPLGDDHHPDGGGVVRGPRAGRPGEDGVGVLGGVLGPQAGGEGGGGALGLGVAGEEPADARALAEDEAGAGGVVEAGLPAQLGSRTQVTRPGGEIIQPTASIVVLAVAPRANTPPAAGPVTQ